MQRDGLEHVRRDYNQHTRVKKRQLPVSSGPLAHCKPDQQSFAILSPRSRMRTDIDTVADTDTDIIQLRHKSEERGLHPARLSNA